MTSPPAVRAYAASMRSRMTLGILTSLLALLAACALEPADRGAQLGARHAEALEAGSLTYAQLIADLEAAETKLETPAEERAFEDAYRAQMRGHEPALARLAAAAAARSIEETGRAVAGEMSRFVGDIAKGIRDMESEDVREGARDFGRKMGRVLHGIQETVEATAQGIEEGLEEAAAESER